MRDRDTDRNRRAESRYRQKQRKRKDLSFSIGSGLMLGKEGPMVQFACTICSWLMYLPIFHKIASVRETERDICIET